MASSSDFDLSEFFFSSHELMCICGHDGYFKKVNPAFVKALGYSESELLSKPYLTFVSPLDRQAAQLEEQNLRDSKVTLNFEIRYICKDGTVRWLSWMCRSVGETIYATARDVTKTKQLESNLFQRLDSVIQQAEESYRETFEHAAIGISHVDIDGRILNVNFELARILGYTPDEIIGRDIRELVPENADEGDGSLVLKLLDGEIRGYDRERQYVRKDGSRVWMLLHISVVRDSQTGELKYFLATHQDISTRKQIEESLKASEESFQSIAEAIPQIVWSKDMRGGKSFYNKRWYEYTGLKPGDDVDAFAVVHPEDQARVRRLWSHSLATGDPIETEYRIKNSANGTYRWHLARGISIRDESHGIVKWFGTCTDIDDYKRIQHALQNAIAEIKETSLEKERLVEREKAAVEASKLKSEFLANISHEIRTPLNGILGMTSLIMETSLTREQKDHAQVIYESGQSLLGLINDILDFSKIEAGKFSLENIDFNLRELVQGVARVLGQNAKAKGISFRSRMHSKTPSYFKGDPTRVRQILFNLVHNAIKFTSEGSVVLSIGSRLQAGGQHCVRLEVQDTGVGIHEDDRPRIFIPFSQADASTTRKYGGTGLGLSICKWVTEQMGGTIEFSSEYGKGSIFWVEIPLAAADSGQPKASAHRLQPIPMEAKNHLPILVAEDHHINQMFIRKVIEKLGFECDVVENGIEVLTALKKRSYSLILMDCHMPHMDGFDTTVEIRKLKDPVLRNIPIVALTADVVKGTRERCLNVGMNQYLSKPVSPDTLQKAIGLVLNQDTFSGELQTIAKTSSRSVILDQKTLQQLAALNEVGKPDIVAELIGDFLKKTPREMSRIGEALERGDLAQVEYFSHGLKSSSGCIGAQKMQKLAALLESRAKEKRIKNPRKWNLWLAEAFEETKLALGKLQKAS